jgi:hypothetical protein
LPFIQAVFGLNLHYQIGSAGDRGQLNFIELAPSPPEVDRGNFPVSRAQCAFLVASRSFNIIQSPKKTEK